MALLAQNNLKIIAKAGRDDIATVYIAEINGKKIEFVESIQPPIPREKKWVLIISSLYGCPVKCKFCDAGGNYQGKMSKDELLCQIDFLVQKRFKDNKIPVEKFKIQFARVGEPSLNENVLDVLEELPKIYDAPGLIPSISTVAPNGTDSFFERLLAIKNRLYKDRFQLQFSIHNTDQEVRNNLIPVQKWDFEKISRYGEKFFNDGERKITLNFAVNSVDAISADILSRYFNPDKFLIKITPVNPTYNAIENNLSSTLDPQSIKRDIINKLQTAGYKAILSIGELEENSIGSNCGQYISNLEYKKECLKNSYTYKLQEV